MSMPAIFLGHGSPMNAIEANEFAPAWRALGESLPPPKAILCISAHWYTRGSGVTAMTKPRTIHDFGGFPQELYEVQYPALGDLDLAKRTRHLLASKAEITLDQSWGLDHGTWSLLVHLFPKVDIPVVQLSIDATLDHKDHLELGKMISDLREEGYLVLGSGNVVHNLRASFASQDATDGFDWAKRFDLEVKKRIENRDFLNLAEYEQIGDEAKLAVPTPEHYLPLLYILGTAGPEEELSYVVEGYQWGGISMLGVRVG